MLVGLEPTLLKFRKSFDNFQLKISNERFNHSATAPTLIVYPFYFEDPSVFQKIILLSNIILAL